MINLREFDEILQKYTGNNKLIVFSSSSFSPQNIAEVAEKLFHMKITNIVNNSNKGMYFETNNSNVSIRASIRQAKGVF